jgi:hypothetical protein
MKEKKDGERISSIICSVKFGWKFATVKLTRVNLTQFGWFPNNMSVSFLRSKKSSTFAFFFGNSQLLHFFAFPSKIHKFIFFYNIIKKNVRYCLYCKHEHAREACSAS